MSRHQKEFKRKVVKNAGSFFVNIPMKTGIGTRKIDLRVSIPKDITQKAIVKEFLIGRRANDRRKTK